MPTPVNVWDIIAHPIFGEGQIVVIRGKKLEVCFRDKQRVILQSSVGFVRHGKTKEFSSKSIELARKAKRSAIKIQETINQLEKRDKKRVAVAKDARLLLSKNWKDLPIGRRAELLQKAEGLEPLAAIRVAKGTWTLKFAKRWSTEPGAPRPNAGLYDRLRKSIPNQRPTRG